VVIGKKADVQFFRQIQVGSIDIRGRMSGEIAAETLVRIRSTGSLDGNVVARAINVEKGGTFSGQLIIGQNNWGQAELIPETEESIKPRSEEGSRRRPPDPYGVPARPSAAA
jgi:cytoskeletal protein CcmA (bactofilin family)